MTALREKVKAANIDALRERINLRALGAKIENALADAAIRAVLEYYAENGAPLAVVKAAVDVRWAGNIYDETRAVAVAQKDFQALMRAALAEMEK